MPEFTAQFDDALKNIEPTKEDKQNAPLAHAEVSEALAEDPVIKGWGFKSLLIGSYKRQVSIRRIKDVDVFGRLTEVDGGVLPSTLLSEFERVLKKAFPAVDGKARVRRQARSLQVSFPEHDGLYVDAVPARPWTSPTGVEAWQLPKREDSDDPQGWQATNPHELTVLTSELNDADHFDGSYVPTIKLLRQTRRSLMGKRKPGGLTVEIAALHAFRTGLVAGPTHADYYTSALRQTGNVLYNAFIVGLGLEDPTIPGEKVVVRGKDEDKYDLANAFLDAASKAEEALGSSDRCAAAKTFRDLLGKAVDDVWDTDYVFPMPADCNSDGTAKRFATVTAGDRNVPAGNRRFG
ncbi:SMODS domain-containing nucleotidyltransferase [Micromonospora palomenae]|uniref:SMODS domain-containing nucleotidyltransferase n=1 Tax=Micromonospora palomenae TaxID=1461247 RepID=UPI003F89D66A